MIEAAAVASLQLLYFAFWLLFVFPCGYAGIRPCDRAAQGGGAGEDGNAFARGSGYFGVLEVRLR